MMRVHRLHRVIWPLLAAFLFLFWGVGLGTVAAQEPEPEWYLIPVDFSVSNAYLEGSISNVNCVLDAAGHNCTHTSSGWVRHHHLYTMDFTPADFQLDGWGVATYTDEANRPVNTVYALVVDSYTSSHWRQDAVNSGVDSIIKSTANKTGAYDGLLCVTAPSFIGNTLPPAAQILIGDCDVTSSLGGANVLPTPTDNLFSWGWRSNVGGAHSFGIRSISYLVYGVPPTPPPPPPAPIGFASACALVIDNGAILTATTNISAAATITTGQLITVSANLVTNGGFEDTTNNLTPSDWQFTNGLHIPNLWSGLNPFTGERHLHSDLMPEIVASQSISLPTAPNYQISAAVRAEHGAAAQTLFVRLGLDTLNVPFSDEPYKVYSTTVQTAGERQLRVEIPDTTGLASPVSVDNVSVIPVEGDALNGYSVYCAAVGEHYQNQNGGGGGGVTIPPPTTIGGYQLPTFITAGECLVCPTPSFSFSSITASIANWFSWLFCGLRSLVTCYIYVWIANIYIYVTWFTGIYVSSFNWGAYLLNSVIGWMFGGIGSFVALVFGYFLGFRNVVGWGIELILGAYGTSSAEVISAVLETAGLEGVANTFNALINLGGATDWMSFIFILTEAAWSIAVATVLGLSNVIIAIFSLVFRIIAALREAVTADATTIQQWAVEGELGSDYMVAFFWSLSTFDDTLAVLRLVPIIYMGVAGFAMMLMYWLVNKWSKSIL